ncbi:hypothetical protein [Siminovitchia fortis]|uniref:hypothetical protein n=1 Tax=Siminovitchia fortis TaxID=254758 RepID=UPI0016428B70
MDTVLADLDMAGGASVRVLPWALSPEFLYSGGGSISIVPNPLNERGSTGIVLVGLFSFY